VDVFRFYNDVNKTHFFTADAGERGTVINTLPNYHYEGVAYHAAAAPAAGLQPLFRFYHVDAQTHFYTADPAERDNVAATLPNFRYEGVAFYEPKADAPPVPGQHDGAFVFDGEEWTSHGTPGPDTMVAHAGPNRLDGRNIMDGGAGNDTITGGPDNDVIIGGPGNDRLTGGGGRDYFVFHPGDDQDTITDFGRDDVMQFNGMTAHDVFIIAAHGPPAHPGEFSSFAGYEVAYGQGASQGHVHLDNITDADLSWVQDHILYRPDLV